MKYSRLLLGMAVVLGLAVLVFLFHGRIHFDARSFLAEMRHVSLGHVAAGVALIYACFFLRAMRWALFLRPQKRVRARDVLGSQFIGFTAVGLFGRLADLTRPYLVAKRTQLSVSSQVAVYTVERMFDLGAAVLIVLASAMLKPSGASLVSALKQIGLLAAGVGFVWFAIAKAELLGEVVRVQASKISEEFGAKIAEKIITFSRGLKVISGAREFASATVLSLAMWGMIAMAYVESVHAFVDTPQLAQMSFAQTMLLMASSIGASVVQLPVVGWFSQIGVLAGAMILLFGVKQETATACGAVILAVCNLSVIPVGLIYAQVEQVSLKKVAEESASSVEE